MELELTKWNWVELELELTKWNWVELELTKWNWPHVWCLVCARNELFGIILDHLFHICGNIYNGSLLTKLHFQRVIWSKLVCLVVLIFWIWWINWNAELNYSGSLLLTRWFGIHINPSVLKYLTFWITSMYGCWIQIYWTCNSHVFVV